LVSFLVPVFFVLVGFRTNFGTLRSPVAMALAGALAIAAVLGKIASAAGVLHRAANRWVVAIGMIPRGEVALIFAALGRTIRIGSRPLIDDTGYAALIAVVILTTLVTPPALKWSLRRATSQTGITRPAA
jgi:Kef-type K+ transport system membrane component KefB